MKRLPILLAAGVFSACASTDAVNRNYGLGKIKRIGVLAFESSAPERLGAEDVFAKYLLELGYNVIERSRLEAVLKEQKLSVSGVLGPSGARGLGQVLGVDALLIGQVTGYQPERKSMVMIEVSNQIHDPVWKEREKKQPDGKKIMVREQVGTTVRTERRSLPQLFSIDAEVGLAVKLVDVETGEIAWIGSASSQGVNGPAAVESVSAYLAKKLSKQLKTAKR